MENFRREFREHRKISVDRLCSFGIYYLVSSAWASSIFEKSLYLFIISILIILSSIEVLILYVLCYSEPQATSWPSGYVIGLTIRKPGFDSRRG